MSFNQQDLPETPEQSTTRTPFQVLTDILSKFSDTTTNIRELLILIEELAVSVKTHYPTAKDKPLAAVTEFTKHVEERLKDKEFRPLIDQDYDLGISRTSAILTFIQDSYIKVGDRLDTELGLNHYNDKETNLLKDNIMLHMSDLAYGKQLVDSVLSSFILVEKIYKYELPREDSLEELSPAIAESYSNYTLSNQYELTREERLAGEEYIENLIITAAVPVVFDFENPMKEMHKYMSTSKAIVLLEDITKKCQNYYTEIKAQLSPNALVLLKNPEVSLPEGAVSETELANVAHCRTVQLLDNLANNIEIPATARVELIYSIVNSTTIDLNITKKKDIEQPEKKQSNANSLFKNFLTGIKNSILKLIIKETPANKSANVSSIKEPPIVIPVGSLDEPTKQSFLDLKNTAKDPLEVPQEQDHFNEGVH